MAIYFLPVVAIALGVVFRDETVDTGFSPPSSSWNSTSILTAGAYRCARCL